jgi:nucleoid DNA-binding protein
VDITAFIRELLFSHDCIIVPGFGGFIGNYTPARIDKNTSTFYPPVKQISFNRNLNHNDGLLIGRISESVKVNYGDARNIVEEFVAGLRKKLEKGEKVVFDDIGSFINNQEGNVQFEPARDVNYYLDSYGLLSFQYIPLEGYDVRKRITRHIDKEPVKHSSLGKVLWRAAIIIIPLLAVLVVIPLKTDIFKSRVEATTMNPLVAVELENNKKAVDENIEPAGVAAASEIILPVAEAEDIYYLIINSFKLRENADIQVSILREDGFAPEIITAPNGFYRVSAMRCNGMEMAVSKKDSLTKKFPGTWIKKI